MSVTINRDSNTNAYTELEPDMILREYTLNTRFDRVTGVANHNNRSRNKLAVKMLMVLTSGWTSDDRNSPLQLARERSYRLLKPQVNEEEKS